MNNKLTKIYEILNGVLPGQVSYALNLGSNHTELSLPHIVYQEVSMSNQSFADNFALFKVSTFQINLITDKKDVVLEYQLEDAFHQAELEYSVVSEYLNTDNISIIRVYEIRI
jgi:hypothetical protein